MSGKAARILLTEKQLDILQKITRSTTVAHRLVQRARVILLAFEGRHNDEIATLVSLHRRQVGLWRRRWKESFDALASIECREPHARLRRAIEDVLNDAELQPHRSKYWLNTTEKDEEVFQTQVEVVCPTWREAPELYFQANTHTVSVDEMPGLQALERIAATIPMQPGQPKRIEYEYKRHGTLCLIGNWHVVEGQMISPTIRQTRTESDFAWHIHHTIRTDATAGWVFVLDNLNVHSSVFGIVSRRVMRRGNFKSLTDLRERLIDFIGYFNRTFAKPFQWNYTGRPVRSEVLKRPATWKEKWAASRQTTLTSALVGQQL